MFYKVFWFFSLMSLSLIKILLLPLFYLINFFVKYRENIIIKNIDLSHKNLNEIEKKKIISKFYFHFFQLICEIFKMFSASKLFYIKRIKIINPELLEFYKNNNQSVILMSGHHNNWEWASQIISITAKQDFLGVYKKLSNKFFDNLLYKSRSRFKVNLIEINDAIKYIINSKDKCQIIGLAADQNPVINKSTYWDNFFGEETPLFLVPEKLAVKMNYPVLFCNMSKLSNGYYTIKYELIEENPTLSKKGSKTNLFIKRLEEKIIEEPNSYLWSHNRWKHKK